MLGILLIYFIGRYFYRLAETFNKNKWAFAIVGIVVYYSGIIITAFLAGILMAIYDPYMLDRINETLFGLMCVPFGILSCFILYKILERSWKKKKTLESGDILDASFTELE